MGGAPRVGKEIFCWDWDTHGGCGKSDKCERLHGEMSEKDARWAVAAELIRRRGRKNRPARIAPENVDGVDWQLGGSNQRVHWGKPLTSHKAWWRQTAGSLNSTLVPQRVAGRPDWKITKRQLGWDKVGMPPNTNARQMTADGEGGLMWRKPPRPTPKADGCGGSLPPFGHSRWRSSGG